MRLGQYDVAKESEGNSVSALLCGRNSAIMIVDTNALLAVLRGPGLPSRAAKVLDGVHTPFDLIDVVRSGLPKQTLTSVVRAATPNAREALALRRRVISDATWKRRTVRLSPDESDRTLRLARIVALARHVWHGDSAGAVEYLSVPRTELQGRSPLECSGTDLGSRLVEDSLQGILFGIGV